MSELCFFDVKAIHLLIIGIKLNMKHLLLTLAIVTVSLMLSMGQEPIRQSNKKDTMNRVERAKQKYEQLFQQIQSVSKSDDPELMTILQRFIFGEVFYIG